MKKRSALKEASLKRILTSGAARLREEGLSGSGISTVMKDAGLTHGAFYSHFRGIASVNRCNLWRRAVDSKDLSDQILNICLKATVRVANRIADQTLNFHAEINCPGRVDIGTRIAKIGRSSITFEQALFRNGRMHATAKTVIMQMNETTRRSEPLSIEAIEHLNRLIPRF